MTATRSVKKSFILRVIRRIRWERLKSWKNSAPFQKEFWARKKQMKYAISCFI